MDVRFRCYGSSISVWRKLALSGFRPWMCSSCCLSMTSTDHSTLLCAVCLVSQDPPQLMLTFPDSRSFLVNTQIAVETPIGPVSGRIVAPCAPRTDAHLVLRPLGIDQVEVTGGFWGQWQERNSKVTTPHALRWLERDGVMDNLRRLGGVGEEPERTGMLFSDSDLYKALEGIAWELGRKPSPELAATISDAVRVLEQAQEGDGYLNSWVQAGRAERFADLAHGHEMYCAGHLIQAGVAHARPTRDGELL